MADTTNQARATRFKCVVCGKLTAGRVPKGGDGTFRYPSRHKGTGGEVCPGILEEAEWVEVTVASAGRAALKGTEDAE